MLRANFEKLYQEQKCTITQFADKLGLSRQNVSHYLNGDRIPDLVTIRSICQTMNVSMDWLCGLSEIRTTKPDFQSACCTLGLTEAAANTLLREQGEAINHLLERDEAHWDLIRYMLENYLTCLKKAIPDDVKIIDETLPGTFGPDQVLLTGAQAADYYARVVGDCVYKALVDEWKADADKREGKE